MSARIGYVSTFDETKGLASVYYQDRSGDVSEELPVFTPFGAMGSLEKGDIVLVEYLESGGAVVIGTFAGIAAPKAGVAVKNGNMILKDQTGSISVSELLAIKKAHEGER